MKSVIHLIIRKIFVALNVLFYLTVLNGLYLFTPTSPNFSHVDGIRNNVGDCRIRPEAAVSGGNLVVVQIICNHLCASVVQKKRKYLLYDIGFFRMRLQSITLFI